MRTGAQADAHKRDKLTGATERENKLHARRMQREAQRGLTLEAPNRAAHVGIVTVKQRTELVEHR